MLFGTMRCIPILALALCAALAGAPATAATSIEGQRFEDTAQVAQTALQLNGVGVRAVAFIKGYAAGLYLTHKAGTYQQLCATPGPKRLQMRMLREVTPDIFIEALDSGMRKHLDERALRDLAQRKAQLERSIEAFGRTVKGDVVDFDYVPGTGTTLAINGKTNGPAIPGADFYDAVMAIFTGDHAVDKRLRQGLLGQ